MILISVVMEVVPLLSVFPRELPSWLSLPLFSAFYSEQIFLYFFTVTRVIDASIVQTEYSQLFGYTPEFHYDWA